MSYWGRDQTVTPADQSLGLCDWFQQHISEQPLTRYTFSQF